MLLAEAFTELTFNVADTDAMEEDNVLVGHLPHHARRLKEGLGQGERGEPLTAGLWKPLESSVHTEQQVTKARGKDQWLILP